MERGSDKQAPRLDDEHKHETESFERGAPTPSRVEEHREVEATEPEDEPAPGPEEDRPGGTPAEGGDEATAPDEPEQPEPSG